MSNISRREFIGGAATAAAVFAVNSRLPASALEPTMAEAVVRAEVCIVQKGTTEIATVRNTRSGSVATGRLKGFPNGWIPATGELVVIQSINGTNVVEPLVSSVNANIEHGRAIHSEGEAVVDAAAQDNRTAHNGDTTARVWLVPSKGTKRVIAMADI